MARQVPDSYFPLRYMQGASGQPDRLPVTRSLGQNAHFLYGHKVMEGGWFASAWNEKSSQHFALKWVSYLQSDGLLLGRFYVPPSLSGQQVLSLLVHWDGKQSAGKLRIEGGGQTWDFDLPNDPTDPIEWKPPEPTSYAISLVGSGAGSDGDTVSVLSLSAFYAEANYDGGTPQWQPLSQGYSGKPFGPDSAYVYRKQIENEAAILCEASSMVWARSFVLPWNVWADPVRVADYLIYVPPHVNLARVAFYARMLDPNEGGAIRVRVDGVERLVQGIGANSGWNLYGLYQGLSIPVSPGKINHIEVRAEKEKPGGNGIELAGFYMWEDFPDQSVICAGNETVPKGYVGMDSEAMTGVRTIYDGQDAQGREVGKHVLLGDVPWLRTYRRRMLINDWLHRCNMYRGGEVAQPWANGVRGDTFGIGGEEPKWDRIPAGEEGGTLIAMAVLPPPEWAPGFTEAEVWVAVSSYARRYSTVAKDEQGLQYTLEPFDDPWIVRVTGGGVVETRKVPALMEPRAEAAGYIASSEEQYWQYYNVGQNLWDWLNAPGGPPIAWVGPFTVGIEKGNVSPIYVEAALERGRQGNFLTCHGVYVRHRPLTGTF